VLHVADDELLMPVAHRTVVRPDALASTFAQITGGDDPVSTSLKGKRSAIVLGHYAQQHPDFSLLLAHAHELARATGATVSVLPQGANAVGAHLVGAVPTRGLDAAAMLARPPKAWLLAGLEAELDIGAHALAAIQSAEFTVVLSAYRNATTEAAHVMLPIGVFAETGGSFVNMEGRVQSFNAAVKPQGQARPGWKVLRMLGSLLETPGCQAETLQEIRQAIGPDLHAWARQGLGNALVTPGSPARGQQPGAQGLQRIAEIGIYAGDPIVRRSRPLQKTADGRLARAARLNPATAAAMGLEAGDVVRVVQGGQAQLPVALDPATPEGCVRIARGVPETAALTTGEVTLQKSTQSVAA
jgi:NADH-quinone oxidoreductase subunit G